MAAHAACAGIPLLTGLVADQAVDGFPGAAGVVRAVEDAGLLLVGVLESLGSPDHAKIGVKFAVGLVILVLVMVNVRKPRIPQGLYFGLLALTVLNIAVAVFWSPVHA